MFLVQLKAEQMLPFRAAFLSFLHNFICFARPPETRSRKKQKWKRTGEREREGGVGRRGRLPQIVNKHINMQHEIGLMSINRRADGPTDRETKRDAGDATVAHCCVLRIRSAYRAHSHPSMSAKKKEIRCGQNEQI